jgi:hypothetical protein
VVVDGCRDGRSKVMLLPQQLMTRMVFIFIIIVVVIFVAATAIAEESVWGSMWL